MNSLPDEVILQIACYLTPSEVSFFSGLSRRFRFLTHDNNHWRQRCYYDSKAVTQRRREELISHQSPATAALARVMIDLPAIGTVSLPRSPTVSKTNARQLIDWDPTYQGEKPNFYQEYLHRHAPVRLSWFEQMNGGDPVDGHELSEATGAGVLYDVDGRASKLYAPLDDGSIGVWQVATAGNDADGGGNLGRRLGRSKKGSLLRERTHMISDRDSGVVDRVTIDSKQRVGYVAVGNELLGVDLETLQTISRHSFAWPISALSEAQPNVPITVGTTFDLHMFDPRLQLSPAPTSDTALQHRRGLDTSRWADTELINKPIKQHATLSQPGPLSILHSSKAHDSSSIWVAGRFTHLLNYDRRYFPCIRGTIHSGARISALTSLPYPYWGRTGLGPHSGPQAQTLPDLEGSTLIAAGAYKGKGSLELYGLSDDARYATLATNNVFAPGRATFMMTGLGLGGVCAQNRQTASSSKLLSVANHGLKIAYSDGDAKVKWVERDGFTSVREFSITTTSPNSCQRPVNRMHGEDLNEGLWAHDDESNNGDIVQKLIPTLAASSAPVRPSVHEDNLIIWTGDGRLGMLGFGKNNGWNVDAWMETADVAESELTRMQEERDHEIRMRRALQWQADETRFMTGLGLPFLGS